MSLQIKKETGVVYDPVFTQIITDIPGGITLKTDRFPDATREIKAGALLNASATSIGLYNLIKTAKLIHNIASAATIMYVNIKEEFKVGEYITGVGQAASAASIVSIAVGAASNAIVLSHNLGTSFATAFVLEEAAVSGSTVGKYASDCILRNTVQVRDEKGNKLGNIFAGGVVRGGVKESIMPYFVTDKQKADLTDRIRFSIK